MANKFERDVLVELHVGQCVFLAVVLDAEERRLQVQMDGQIQCGSSVLVLDPITSSHARGKVLQCTASGHDSFDVEIARSAWADGL